LACIAAFGQDLLLAADDVLLHVFERFRFRHIQPPAIVFNGRG
jgi:hypothetical protein